MIAVCAQAQPLAENCLAILCVPIRARPAALTGLLIYTSCRELSHCPADWTALRSEVIVALSHSELLLWLFLSSRDSLHWNTTTVRVWREARVLATPRARTSTWAGLRPKGMCGTAADVCVSSLVLLKQLEPDNRLRVSYICVSVTKTFPPSDGSLRCIFHCMTLRQICPETRQMNVWHRNRLHRPDWAFGASCWNGRLWKILK